MLSVVPLTAVWTESDARFGAVGGDEVDGESIGGGGGGQARE